MLNNAFLAFDLVGAGIHCVKMEFTKAQDSVLVLTEGEVNQSGTSLVFIILHPGAG